MFELCNMRNALLIMLFCVTIACAGCSYSTDFIVVNSSSALLQVTYTIVETGIDPLRATGVITPATLDVSELSGRKWNRLLPSQYSYDRASRAVRVTLAPNQCLLINQGGELRSDSRRPSGFVIKKIELVGINGAQEFEDLDAYERFVPTPKPFYRFGPSHQFALTYY